MEGPNMSQPQSTIPTAYLPCSKHGRLGMVIPLPFVENYPTSFPRLTVSSENHLFNPSPSDFFSEKIGDLQTLMVYVDLSISAFIISCPMKTTIWQPHVQVPDTLWDTVLQSLIHWPPLTWILCMQVIEPGSLDFRKQSLVVNKKHMLVMAYFFHGNSDLQHKNSRMKLLKHD
jgi:hypothetical protein